MQRTTMRTGDFLHKPFLVWTVSTSSPRGRAPVLPVLMTNILCVESAIVLAYGDSLQNDFLRTKSVAQTRIRLNFENQSPPGSEAAVAVGIEWSQ